MRIKILTTGGSIDKIYSTKHSDFVVGEPTIDLVLQMANVNLEYDVEPILRKDSLEITNEDRNKIAEKVGDAVEKHILITHGTDTMIQTAEVLRGISAKVIVLTGAMQPAAFKETDAVFNIGAAVIALQTLPDGVYLVMNGRVLDPSKTRKNMETNQFESI